MATLVTVLKSGGRYDPVWVERLAAGARRHAPGFERILCLSDRAVAVEGVEHVPLRHDWPAWWAKIEALRPGLVAGAAVLCDLDTVFCGDASTLTEAGTAVMEDHFLKGRASTALLRWQDDEWADVYAAFAADPVRWMRPGSCGPVPNAVHGDQVVVDHLMRTTKGLPPFLQDRHPGLIDFYDPAKREPGPVVVFIGAAKPDNAEGPTVGHWRGEEGLSPAIRTRSRSNR